MYININEFTWNQCSQKSYDNIMYVCKRRTALLCKSVKVIEL